jgi:hypothetical protein
MLLVCVVADAHRVDPSEIAVPGVAEAIEAENEVRKQFGRDAQGRAYKIVFRHIYDGMPHATTGIPTYDSTIYTRIGNTINAVRFRTGKPVEAAQVVIVPGKTLTNTAEGIDENNQPYHYVQIYDRQ